jgi:hypothetical protein
MIADTTTRIRKPPPKKNFGRTDSIPQKRQQLGDIQELVQNSPKIRLACFIVL